MSTMNLRESVERYNESLKRAASRARELAKVQKLIIWESIANSLDAVRIDGLQLANALSLSKTDTETQIKQLNAQTAEADEKAEGKVG